MLQVRFVRDWLSYTTGDVVEFADEDLATSLIQSGVCVQTEMLPRWEIR
jgi:hypothetical protein